MTKARITTVMFNSTKPEELVKFWCEILQVEAHPHNEKTEHIWLFSQDPNGFKLGFQRVAEVTPHNSQVHIDVAVDDLDTVQNLVLSLGGTHIKTTKLKNGFEWRVLADPQGNHFCIFPEMHA